MYVTLRYTGLCCMVVIPTERNLGIDLTFGEILFIEDKEVGQIWTHKFVPLLYITL